MVIIGKQPQPKNGDVTFMYNSDGSTRCDIYYDGQYFTGYAKCLPEDEDFWSERTGCFIAECKANIKKLKYLRNQLTPALSTLKNLEKTLQCCKKYNADSFEAKRLRKEIYIQQEKIDELNEAIKEEQEYLSKYITEKDAFYHKIRAKRANETK